MHHESEKQRFRDSSHHGLVHDRLNNVSRSIRTIRRPPRKELFGDGYAIFGGIMDGITLLLWKLSIPASFKPITLRSWQMLFTNPFFLGSFLSIFLAWSLIIIAFSHGKSSVLFPIVGGSSYLTIQFGALVLLKEPFNIWILASIIIIIISIYFLKDTGHREVIRLPHR